MKSYASRSKSPSRRGFSFRCLTSIVFFFRFRSHFVNLIHDLTSIECHTCRLSQKGRPRAVHSGCWRKLGALGRLSLDHAASFEIPAAQFRQLAARPGRPDNRVTQAGGIRARKLTISWKLHWLDSLLPTTMGSKRFEIAIVGFPFFWTLPFQLLKAIFQRNAVAQLDALFHDGSRCAQSHQLTLPFSAQATKRVGGAGHAIHQMAERLKSSLRVPFARDGGMRARSRNKPSPLAHLHSKCERRRAKARTGRAAPRFFVGAIMPHHLHRLESSRCSPLPATSKGSFTLSRAIRSRPKSSA